MEGSPRNSSDSNNSTGLQARTCTWTEVFIKLGLSPLLIITAICWLGLLLLLVIPYAYKIITKEQALFIQYAYYWWLEKGIPIKVQQTRNKNIKGDFMKEQIQQRDSKIQETDLKQFKKYLVAGGSGAGKSSLLNLLFGLDLPTGLGGCTHQRTRVSVPGTPNQIYDSPGLSSHSAFQQTEDFAYALQFDKIFIVFEDSLKPVANFVQFVHKCGKEMVFVRSKCDNFGGGQLRSVSQEMAVDRALLASWGIVSPKLLATTANVKSKSFDEDKVKQLLLD